MAVRTKLADTCLIAGNLVIFENEGEDELKEAAKKHGVRGSLRDGDVEYDDCWSSKTGYLCEQESMAPVL